MCGLFVGLRLLLCEFPMRYWNRKWRSLFLLLTVLSVFVATPLLENSERGETIIVANLYLTLVAATIKLSERRVLLLAAVPLAVVSMTLLLFSHFYRTRPLVVAGDLGVVVFIALVCISLFIYLGREGEIPGERLSVSVCLYFLIALEWFGLYALVEAIQPGSFADSGITLMGTIPASKILYFSLTTMTTSGFGDIVAVKPAARMLASLEATTGVLYIAITVARLVASYQNPNRTGS